MPRGRTCCRRENLGEGGSGVPAVDGDGRGSQLGFGQLSPQRLVLRGQMLPLAARTAYDALGLEAMAAMATHADEEQPEPECECQPGGDSGQEQPADRDVSTKILQKAATPDHVASVLARHQRWEHFHGRCGSALLDREHGVYLQGKGPGHGRGRFHSTYPGSRAQYHSVTERHRATLSSGSLPLPHFGDWTHDGQPVAHSHAAIASRVACSQAAARA